MTPLAAPGHLETAGVHAGSRHAERRMAAEYSDWLTEVGFVDPQVVPFEAPGANGVVTARNP